MGLGRALNVAIPQTVNTLANLQAIDTNRIKGRAAQFELDQAKAKAEKDATIITRHQIHAGMGDAPQIFKDLVIQKMIKNGFADMEGNSTIGDRDKGLQFMETKQGQLEMLGIFSETDTSLDQQIKQIQSIPDDGVISEEQKLNPKQVEAARAQLPKLLQQHSKFKNGVKKLGGIVEESGASSPVGKLIQDRDALVKQGLQPTDPRIVAIDNAINKTGAGEAKRSIKTVPDETSSTGFRFKDILSGESFDEAPKPSSLVKINLPKPISPAERTSIAEGEAAIDSLNNIKSLFDEKFVGPIAGRAGTVGELFGANPQEQSSFIAATAAFKNQIIKEITGAQMSEVEAKRILKQVPDVNNPPTVWMARWEQSLRNIERLQKRRIEILRRTFNDGSDLSTISDADLLKQLGGK